MNPFISYRSEIKYASSVRIYPATPETDLDLLPSLRFL